MHSRRSPLHLAVGLTALCFGPALLRAEPTLPPGAVVLSARCLACHNPQRKSGGVEFGTSAGAAAAGLRRGDDPKANRVLRAVLSGKMPPTGPLPAEEVRALRSWLLAGAPYPGESLPPRTPAELPLWSMVPPQRVVEPRTPWDRLAHNGIDRFVFDRLQQEGLSPSPEAEPRTLLRRVTVDLTGLPPTPEEVAAYLADRRPGAYERVVDRLLASPAYGERWGQHWLDVVRFGESHGYEQNHMRPNAWPYRDYVIRSLNEDKPYDRFVQEQLAGDLLAAGDPWVDAGTGFLVAGIHDTVGNQTEEGSRQQRSNDLDDLVSTTCETFLGLTAGCARCHDHKFDPIPSGDYYRLAAVFAGVRHGERALGTGTPRNEERFTAVEARYLRFVVTATNDGAEPGIDELEAYGPGGAENLALASTGTVAMASSLLPGYEIHQIAHLNDGRFGNDWSWISGERGAGWAQLRFPRAVRLDRVVWSRDGLPVPRFADRTPTAYRVEVSLDGTEWRVVARREAGTPAPIGRFTAGTRAYAGNFTAPEPVYQLRRGDVMQRGEQVSPAALSRLSGLPGELAVGGVGASSRIDPRLALGRWLTDPRNPLPSRVIVNRLWQGHFGRGLVSTPNDFGHNGDRPSHPELLDWLALELQRTGWRLKAMHRLMVTSHVYRQAQAIRPDAARKDAGNRLLWRMPLRRLEAEALRDAVLATSGSLDRAMGGPGFQLFRYRIVNVGIYEPLDDPGPETYRRGVYRQFARAIRDDLLGSFDCPESAQRSPRRASTTTALQALSLLNGPFMLRQAGLLASRIEKEAGEDPAAQIRRAFQLAFGRDPSASERVTTGKVRAEFGLAAVCRSLLNTNEFLYY